MALLNLSGPTVDMPFMSARGPQGDNIYKGGRGSRFLPFCSRLAAASGRSPDNEGRSERHSPRHVVEVGRGRHHRLVNLREVLLGAATLDVDDVAQFLVACRHGG